MPAPEETWDPELDGDTIDGFDRTIGPNDLREACRRLQVEPFGAIEFGYLRYSLGTAVVGPDGRKSWVKVTALRGIETHPSREAELAAAAITGALRPSLMEVQRWSSGERRYLAMRMALAGSPTVERGHFAGDNAKRVTSRWIYQLKQAIAAIGRSGESRASISPEHIASAITQRFGTHVPNVADEWRCAHGDLHWTNLTAPTLALLDWERWGMAPRGMDAAHLILFSCTAPQLVRRLEAAFADDLNTPSGRVARLAVVALRLNDIDRGILHPFYKPFIEAMAQRALADIR